MIWFQLITIPVISVLVLRSLWHLLRGDRPRHLWVQSALLWSIAGLAVSFPDWTTRLAAVLGIGRGADLLVYIVAISFIAGCFYFYAKISDLHSQLTEVMRHLAIHDGLQRWQSSSRAPGPGVRYSRKEKNEPDSPP